MDIGQGINLTGVLKRIDMLNTNPEFHDVNGAIRLYVARTPAQFNELLGYDPATDSVNASLRVRREEQTQGQPRPHDGEAALFPFASPGKSVAVGNVSYDGMGSYKTYRINYAQLKESGDSLAGIYLVPAHPGATDIKARESNAPATSDPGKAALNVSYAEAFKLAGSEMSLPGPEPVYHWNENTVRELADVARRIKDARDNTRFFGIGNSPSYIVYAIEKMAQRDGTAAPTAHVPFSDRFLEQVPSNSDDATYSFKYNSVQLMSARNRDEYRNFLSNLGLHPEEIVARHQSTGERTAIMDNIQAKGNFQGGGSFVSFITFMHDWAKELGVQKAFSGALDCIAVTQMPIPPAIAVPEAGLRVPVESFAISSTLLKAIIGNESRNTDRFVPPYAPHQWDGPPKPVPAENLHLVETVKAKIRQAIEESQPASSSRPRAKAQQNARSTADPA